MPMFGKKPQQQQQQQDHQQQQQGNEELTKVIQELPNMVASAVTQAMQQQPQPQPQPQPKEPEPEPQPKDPFEGVDFENLDNKGLAQVMLQTVNQQLESFNENVDKKVGDLKGNMEQRSLKEEIKTVADKEGDKFWRYRDEMKQLSQQYPALAPTDLYNLAKARKPEIEEEFNKEQQQQQDKDKQNEKPKFGGMLPTSSLEETDDNGMDFGEASQKAWDEVMEEVPDTLIGGSNN